MEAILEVREYLIRRSTDSPDPVPRGTFQPGVLEAAIDRAHHGMFPPGVEPDLFLRTAFLLRGIVGEHAFANGCKRTGLLVAGITLDLNGYRLTASQDEAVDFMMGVADQTETDPIAMADWLRSHSEKIGPGVLAAFMQRLKPRKR